MTEIMHCTPDEVRGFYPEITPLYRAAFAGDPWYEVSKCADKTKEQPGCVGGFSKLSIGEHCTPCSSTLVEPAYEAEELAEHFDDLAEVRMVSWYFERVMGNIAVAIVASKATAEQIAGDIITRGEPELADWAVRSLGSEPFAWVHDVFANPGVRPTGNLINFVPAVTEIARRLEVPRIAYSTINPRMVKVAERFGNQATVYHAHVDVPDRRNFVVINAP